MTSIIIPAHNEESVIERCLHPLLDISADEKFEIIVVCNGCTDKTADKVAQLSENFVCIETEKASKSNALNLGDEAATSFPRFYVDADVCISAEAISAVSSALDKRYLAAAPEVKMNLDDSSWLVKAYYDVWLSLPYCRAGMIGAGVYALSEKGRNRFKVFPDVIADDGYVRRLFNESERGVVRGCYSTVSAPKHIAGLIKIKTRSQLGRYELEDKYPAITNNEEKDYLSAIKDIVLNPVLWLKAIVYLAINLIVRVRASLQAKRNISIWERDHSSR